MIRPIWKIETMVLQEQSQIKTTQKQHATRLTDPRGGGVLPYIGYIGMCGPKGYGFSAVLVIDRESILADFGHFGLK